MASVITLTGIDQALSQLKYASEMTLKYRFVKTVRDYYVDDNSLASLRKIEHASLIKLLWDTQDDPEIIKNKRKNLTGLRSSVNADLKKLYENGLNPEGIKIGPDNIFVMSENAKDNILNQFGYELQPDGTLKLDQIMDILKVANETVSGALSVEDATTKDDLSKKDQLKDLIKRLSEKLGLGNPEFPKAGIDPENKPSESRVSVDGVDKTVDIGAVDEDEDLFEVQDDEDGEAVEEIGDVIEDEILDEIVDVAEEDMSDIANEEILDDVEDVVTDEIEDLYTETISGEEEIDDILENAAGDEDSEPEYIEVDEGDGLGDGLGDGIAGATADEFGDGGNEKEAEQLGLPADSLGQEYGSEKETKLKKDKLLAEAFDGYLGSMDRYYNHYILIDGGQYLIGSRHPKKGEELEKMIILEPFYFGRFPVTNGLFEIFVEKTGYKTTAEKVGYGTVYYGRFEKRKDDQTGLLTSRWNSSLYCSEVKGACWYRPSGPESTLHNKRDHPVVQISLEDASAFAAWTGKRLPTESEWEAASRTAKGWTFPWGHEWINDAGNIEDSGIADTTPVDKYAEFENDFGIVDVLGNVLEWTDNGFETTSQENNASNYRIAKGGSWVSGNDIRLFSRFKLKPDSHSNILGFRCVAY
jgi:formylglycine-generating enzyme required for sulfatase activity